MYTPERPDQKASGVYFLPVQELTERENYDKIHL